MEGFSLKFQAGKEKMCIPFVYCNGNNVTTGNFPSESLTSVAVSLESMKKQRLIKKKLFIQMRRPPAMLQGLHALIYLLVRDFALFP